MVDCYVYVVSAALFRVLVRIVLVPFVVVSSRLPRTIWTCRLRWWIVMWSLAVSLVQLHLVFGGLVQFSLQQFVLPYHLHPFRAASYILLHELQWLIVVSSRVALYSLTVFLAALYNLSLCNSSSSN